MLNVKEIMYETIEEDMVAALDYEEDHKYDQLDMLVTDDDIYQISPMNLEEELVTKLLGSIRAKSTLVITYELDDLQISSDLYVLDESIEHHKRNLDWLIGRYGLGGCMVLQESRELDKLIVQRQRINRDYERRHLQDRIELV